MVELRAVSGEGTGEAPRPTLFHVKPDVAARAHVNAQQATLMANHAAQTADAFWIEQSSRLDWFTPPTLADQSSFEGDVRISWFADGVLNASVNCLDRHLAENGDRTALIWEADEEGVCERISFRDLHARVCRFANALRGLGIGRGDVVGIYLPMVPEAVVAMLACARIGAVHTVFFSGFSPAAVAGRLRDCRARLLVTADEQRRGGKRIPLKANADAALADAPSVEHAIVVRVTGSDVPRTEGRDLDYAALVADASPDCPPERMAAEDPLFILYTSGSTGAPKGLVHTTGGYLVWASFTHELVFDHRTDDVYWCTADVGWITGHTYVVYGPLANGATAVIFEGQPTWPDAGRLWRMVDRHAVTLFYTAPTAIRALMRFGDAPVTAASRASLRLLASVGEPINPEAWLWYHDVVGDDRCPVIDTWWQTETGGIMIAPLPGATPLKPGSATWPLPGVLAELVDAEGRAIEGEGEGQLVLARAWPGLARTIHGDHERYRRTYFEAFPGRYTSGDGARRDADGYYWITGRVDDVINVSGHRIGTAEIEAALNHHPGVVESAVVGVPHEVKGQGIYAFVVVRDGTAEDDATRRELDQAVRRALGGFAVAEHLQFAPDLPKTRSGKIMRRILRKIAAGDTEDLGDVTTLADPSVVGSLVEGRG